MKKQIALIIISMLAIMPANAQNVKCNQNENEKRDCENFSCETLFSEKEKCDFCCGENIKYTCDFSLWQDGFFGCDEVKPSYPWCGGEEDVPSLPDNTPIFPDVPQDPQEPDSDDNNDGNDPSQDVPGDGENTDIDSRAYEVFALVNEYRKNAGLSALTYDTDLAVGAEIRAEETVKLFSHTRPDGRRCFTVLDDIGYAYKSAGENIAYGQKTADEVMSAWMNSEGHRENILNENFTKVAIGVYEKGGVVYWTQIFAS